MIRLIIKKEEQYDFVYGVYNQDSEYLFSLCYNDGVVEATSSPFGVEFPFSGIECEINGHKDTIRNCIENLHIDSKKR